MGDWIEVILEPLEVRTFLSGNVWGADTVAGVAVNDLVIASHHHYHHTPHRHWRHPSHTIAPDALLGHFIGTSSGYGKKADLTLAEDRQGNFSGLLLMDSFAFGTFSPIAHSDGTFNLEAAGNVFVRGTLTGSIVHDESGGTKAMGTYVISNAGARYYGNFTMVKVS